MKTLCFALLTCLSFPLMAADVGIRLRVGLTDKEATDWSGQISVEPGRVGLISGWRFAQGDSVTGAAQWKCRTRPIVDQKRRSNNPQREQARANAATSLPIGDNGVLISLQDVTEDSRVTVKFAKGEFSFVLSEVPLGVIAAQLEGAVEVERTAAATTFTEDRHTDDDYPSGALAADGTLWVAWQSYTPGLSRAERAKSYEVAPTDLASLAKAPGGDQLWLSSTKGKEQGKRVAITGEGVDLYRSAVAVDGAGRVWVIWAQNTAYKAFPDNPVANFDIFARSLDPKTGTLSEVTKLSDAAESDVWPVATTDGAGRVWVAWQGARDQVFRIWTRHQDGQGWSAVEQVSTQSRNCWAPAITATRDRVAIAWDTYEKGDYDVWVREFVNGKAGDARPVANSADYEARPAVTYDTEGALWIAWEKSGPTWGKNWGALVQNQGIGLYRDRQIGLLVWKNGQWMEPAGNFRAALPGASGPRRRQRNVRVPAIEPGAETRKAGEEAEAAKNFAHNNLARITCDAQGRVWIFARSRQNDFRTALGSLWFDWAIYAEGDRWVGPSLVPHSDNLLYNVPVVLPSANDGIVIVHSSDHRHDRQTGPRRGGGNGALDAADDPYDNDLYFSPIAATGAVQPAKLVPATQVPEANPVASPAVVKEREEIARLRGYRTMVEGRSLQIQRGEFHRHTEISGDGGNDGPLEDMWRYAIDVAGMDWLGCGDHDNGAGREYPWWLTQKTTDAFFLPGSFNPLYTYERSVRYPEGHRNVIFTRRGIRTLPRLPISDRTPVASAPDTQMLYKYLHFFNGICASHTSATSMGTDWRDNDPVVEPFVEIYQGARQNYERPGAPRCPTEGDAIGGWEPLGFVNLALQKGYRLAFESSSDHGSTHISYALVYTEGSSREAVFAAMQKRHVYAATDNIVADFRCGDRMMGDEFTSATAPKLKIHLEGTAPFKKVTFIKDDVEVFAVEPNLAECDVEWSDPQPTPGKTSYYYVRGEQADGELVWASPMWIKFEPAK